jgi:hypothetical protein
MGDTRIWRSPLPLNPDELALLDLLGPPHLIATPRAVTRLANSYGLLTAIRRDHHHDDLAEHTTPDAPEPTYRPYRAGMVLLSALITHPALGPRRCYICTPPPPPRHHPPGRSFSTNYGRVLTRPPGGGPVPLIRG